MIRILYFSFQLWRMSMSPNIFQNISSGGDYYPTHCHHPPHVAIVVPYRDRLENLEVFLHYMHPFLMRQNIHYKIYIITQGDKLEFNRAMLLNVGFKEALVDQDWPCFVFHDVDHLPEDNRNLYDCLDLPKHMASAVDTGGYQLYYDGFFGGVFSILKTQFEQINGASNLFWGWGGEDDNILKRIQDSQLNMVRISQEEGRYTTTKHGAPHKNTEYGNVQYNRWIVRYN